MKKKDDTITEPSESIKKEVDAIQQQEKALLKEAKEALQDKNLRLLAEMENLRKKHSEEISNIRKYSKTQLALDIVNILDQMEMALSEAEKLKKIASENHDNISNQIQNLCKGLDYIAQGINSTLESHGIKKMMPLKQEFNPLEHEAMEIVTESEYKNNTISKILLHGFTIEDRVLRPAKVAIVKNT